MDDANERSLLDSDEHPMNPETRNASTFLKANAAANAVGVVYHDNSEKHVWEFEDDADLGDGKMSDFGAVVFGLFVLSLSFLIIKIFDINQKIWRYS